MQTKFFGRMFSIMLMFILINATIAFAENGTETNGTGESTGDTGTGADGTGDTGTGTDGTGDVEDGTGDAGNDAGDGTEGIGEDPGLTANITCKNPSTHGTETVLQPQEWEKLKQGLQNLNKPLGKVFTGQEIKSPDQKKIKPDDRDQLENTKVVIPTGVGRDAVLAEMPSAKFSPSEAPFLLNSATIGPFAAGFSLDDTIRIGRCENLSSQIDQNSCPVTDKRLEFRNSGEGIVENYKNVWEDLKDWIGVGPDMDEKYTDEQTEKMQAALISEPDPQNVTYKEVKRPTGNIIPNSMKTQSFSAEMGTTCQNSSCVIGSYSAFDKYFNSWYAADLVVSNFGPTVFGQSKRLLGNLGRRGWPWTMSENAFYKSFRKKFMNADSLLGKARVKNLNTRIDKYGFGDFRKGYWEGTGWQSGYAAVKGGSTRKLLDDWLKAGGKLDTEITDPIRRGEFFKVVKEWRSIAKTQGSLMGDAAKNYNGVTAKYGINSAEGKAALIEYAQNTSKLMREIDQMTHLDFPEYWVKEEIAGLYTKGIKNTATGQIVPLNGDSANITAVMQKFEEEGHWQNWDEFASAIGGGKGPESIFETTPDGFLKLYEPDPKGRLIDTVQVDDLQKNFSAFQDKMARLENGDFIKIDSTSLDHIAKNGAPSGKVKIYDMGWADAENLTPEDFAARFTRFRVKNRLMGQLEGHTDRLYNGLIEKGWAGQNRRYLSILDKSFSQEENILKSYFSLKGGAKWTVVPFLYWGAKRGVNFDGLSAYQLPDTWSSTTAYLGDTPLYDDAFIDFFANAGSDEGDIFSQVLNILPWKMVLNKVSDEFNPLKETFDSWTGRGAGGYRSTVENVALFSQTGNECKTCHWTASASKIDPAGNVSGDLEMSFKTREGLKNIMVEDVISDDAKEKGTTLISFAHHTNLNWEGPDKTGESEPIDLAKAITDKDTCRDALDKIPIIGWFGRISGGKPSRVGAALAFGESMLYFGFGWSGIIGSVIQQTLIAPEFADCVDDLEGYYLHLYAPAGEKEKKSETPNEKASGISGEMFKNLTNTVLGPEQENDKSKGLVELSTDKIREEAQKLADKAESKTILQATVDAVNLTSGRLFSKQLFFFWWKGEQRSLGYDTKTKVLIEDPESDIDLDIDKEKGEISINGEPIITNPDLVRLTMPNGNIPAYEIPQRITKIVLPKDSKLPLFRMSVNSDMLVDTSNNLGKQIFDCIKKGVEEQTGVALNSTNLSEAFGKVKFIATETHPNIAADEQERSITAEGTPREIVQGNSAFALVRANRDTEIDGGPGGKGNFKVGKMKSIQFENGEIIFKPETNELLIWLRHHDKAILHNNDVAGLIAKPTVYDDPSLECPDPAIDLEAIPKAGSDLISSKVDNFNQSMDTMGPFKMFDTESHRFIFYSKMVEGECKDFFKMVDKKTGEVYESEILGPIENTPTGVKFNTADGQSHALDFSTENGMPMVSYNGQPPEILRTATGPNGSFWYDPVTGNWYPENAQFIPLDESFKQQGFNTGVNPDGSVSQKPGGNPLTVNVGGGTGMPFNLPSLPESIFMMLLFFSLLLTTMVFFRIRIEKNTGKK